MCNYPSRLIDNKLTLLGRADLESDTWDNLYNIDEELVRSHVIDISDLLTMLDVI